MPGRPQASKARSFRLWIKWKLIHERDADFPQACSIAAHGIAPRFRFGALIGGGPHLLAQFL